ncbi:RDD family protein [Enterococcus sp. BWB1-3]|uniref:RDD family protein n=1 Tax=unclassified Enterococcus TaxID=2608891 RepID=UPI001921685E|nr:MULTISPECIES: RDD family protein [unclassified Enterococcus]MBL1230199.1 RDD family protein [Enterococcus sp. BWB1-3]MCB5953758.1 RDD family protein [Enterococcus sp. CWB-B31]
MTFLIKRIMAQAIDFFLGILLLFVCFGLLLPQVKLIISNDVVRSILGMLLFVLAYFLIQYPFMINGQTVGKGFYRLQIISTDEERTDVPAAVVFQREILCKLMSCFFICVPMLTGKLGGHEEATHTKLIELKKVRVKREIEEVQ